MDAITNAKHLALFQHMLGTGQRSQRFVSHSNPGLYCSYWTKRLEDADYASSFLSSFPIKTPVPEAARWNARLKARWDGRGERPSQKKEREKKKGAVIRELAMTQRVSILCLQPRAPEKLLTQRTIPWQNTIVFAGIPVIHEEYLCFVLGHLP